MTLDTIWESLKQWKRWSWKSEGTSELVFFVYNPSFTFDFAWKCRKHNVVLFSGLDFSLKWFLYCIFFLSTRRIPHIPTGVGIESLVSCAASCSILHSIFKTSRVEWRNSIPHFTRGKKEIIYIPKWETHKRSVYSHHTVPLRHDGLLYIH